MIFTMIVRFYNVMEHVVSGYENQYIIFLRSFMLSWNNLEMVNHKNKELKYLF